MNSRGRERLRSESEFRYYLARFENGIQQILKNKSKRLMAIAYAAIVVVILVVYNLYRINNPYAAGTWQNRTHFSYKIITEKSSCN